MEEKRIYLLAQFDEHTNNTLADIYDKLVQANLIGEQTKGIPYHFTLGSFDLKYENQILDRVQAVSLNSKAFDISLSYIGLFGLRVLFLAPSMNFELLNRISGCHKWVAHATIIIDSPVNIQAAIPIVAQSFSPFTAKIESIGVYEFFPKKKLAEYKFSS